MLKLPLNFLEKRAVVNKNRGTGREATEVRTSSQNILKKKIAKVQQIELKIHNSIFRKMTYTTAIPPVLRNL